MAENDGAKAPAGAGDDAALRRQRSERLNRIMWAYICGAITLLSFVVGLGPSFIPLGFGILGGILAWQIARGGDRRHSTLAGALALGGIMIWLTYNWPTIQRFLAG
ncbi:MAG TPA: hypothetical protein VJO12_02245 [Stellaceae bacterium]|nr:hypothetical protein [Stellaceae bacterium]